MVKARFGDRVRVDGWGPVGLVVGIRGPIAVVDYPVETEGGRHVGEIECLYLIDELEVVTRGLDA